MAVTVDTNEIWKWFNIDWSLFFNFYGQDFNPTVPQIQGWEAATIYQWTTSFDVSDFQPWHEVGCWMWVISPNWWTGRVRMDFYQNNSPSWFYTSTYIDDASAVQWMWYIYFWIDKDEVRPWYSSYKVHYYSVDWQVDFWSPTFTVSSLSIDSTLHPAWYLWVEWSHLCYTDNTGDEIWQNWYGYKHKIAYDNGYSYNVWGSNKWYIWLDTDNSLRIYYVDAVWVRRRTYASKERYGWDVRVWSSNKWYMWVWVDRAEDWYWHLCFIAPNWSKRRILNWPPAWYE